MEYNKYATDFRSYPQLSAAIRGYPRLSDD
jgi:hypothetical protein